MNAMHPASAHDSNPAHSTVPSAADPALDVLRDTFGFNAFRGAQRDIVQHVVAGGDALVLMPTGGGKSLCYQIPALLRAGTAVVVSPLIALMQDQVAALRQLGVRAAFLTSSLEAREALQTEAAFERGELDLLYIAPERLSTARCQELLGRTRLALFAIDEAHCVSQWGHDFRPEYLQLSLLHERFPDVPRIALTATADPQTRAEIIARLALQDARLFVSSFDRPNIRYTIVDKDDARSQLLRFIRARHAGESGIVYCLSRRRVDETAAWLREHGVNALPYHAGMETGLRNEHQARFQREEGLVMVATIAFGMGIDKPDVRFVAHLDLPKSMEGYYQETGRAGRDGLPADAWMAYGLGDVVQQRRMIDESEASEAYKRLSTAKLDALLGLCETALCRRVRLLGYFGETSTPCGNCDNCLSPPETWDAGVAAQKALSTMYRTEQRFGVQHLIDVLLGRDSERIRRWNHQHLNVFGIGKELDEKEWRGVFRQLVAMGFARVDHNAFGALHLTEAARPILRGEQAIAMRRHIDRPRTRAARKRSASGAGGPGPVPGQSEVPLSAAAAALLMHLKAWRLQEAREQGVPAYVILHDATLATVAAEQPTSLEQLGGISGFGAKKLERYGAALLALIAGDTAAAGNPPVERQDRPGSMEPCVPG